MRHFAVVGSGPAGFYTAEALAKAYAGKEESIVDLIQEIVNLVAAWSYIDLGVEQSGRTYNLLNNDTFRFAELILAGSSAYVYRLADHRFKFVEGQRPVI